MVLRPTTSTQQAAAQIATENGIEALATWRIATLGLDCVVFRVGSSPRTAFLERRLRIDSRVESVYRNQLFDVRVMNKPLPASATQAAGRGKTGAGAGSAEVHAEADAYADLQYAPAMLGLAAAHHRVNGAGTTVGVIDTGADVAHPDLRGRVTVAKSFVRHQQGFTQDRHGTAVIGAIAAIEGNGIGIGGVAPGAEVEAFKACWEEPGQEHAVCSSYTLALALDHAAGRNLDVLNLSLGGPSDRLLSRLVESILATGTVVVAAGSEADEGFPTEVEGVFSVRACDEEGALWPRSGSALGEGVLVAPGAEIFGLATGGAYDIYSGESLASAHVAGVVALLIEAAPRASAATLEQALREGSKPIVAGGPRIVDACRALAALGVKAKTGKSELNCNQTIAAGAATSF